MNNRKEELEKISNFLDTKGLCLERIDVNSWHIDVKKGDLKYGTGYLTFSKFYGWRVPDANYPQFQEYINEALGEDQYNYGEDKPYISTHG